MAGFSLFPFALSKPGLYPPHHNICGVQQLAPNHLLLLAPPHLAGKVRDVGQRQQAWVQLSRIDSYDALCLLCQHLRPAACRQ